MNIPPAIFLRNTRIPGVNTRHGIRLSKKSTDTITAMTEYTAIPVTISLTLSL